MKIVFGVLSLLVVLAIVGTVGRKQLQALDVGTSTRLRNAASQAQLDRPAPGARDAATAGVPGGMPGATAADPAGPTVQQQSRNLQQRFGEDAARALQQGADRNARAAP